METMSVYTDRGKVRKTVAFLGAINHPTRQDLINAIVEQKQVNVSELSDLLKLKQTEVSQHLAVLRNLDLVMGLKIGKYVYYSVNEEKIALINAILSDFPEIEE